MQAVRPACTMLKPDWLKDITFNQKTMPLLDQFIGEIVHLV